MILRDEYKISPKIPTKDSSQESKRQKKTFFEKFIETPMPVIHSHFLNEHRPPKWLSNPLPWKRARKAAANPFHTLKICARFAAIKGRREIGAVSGHMFDRSGRGNIGNYTKDLLPGACRIENQIKRRKGRAST